MNRLQRFWRRTPSPLRKTLIFIVGWLIIIAGVAMLALPGPGWATIFLGCAVLATEFAFAKKIRTHITAKFKQAMASLRHRGKLTHPKKR